MSSFVTIARIVRTRGVRGEVESVLLTDFPERFESTRRVRVVRQHEEFWEALEQHWFHRGRVILKFAGRDRPHEVEELVGGEVQVLESERVQPPDGTFFHSDLVGCQVYENGKPIGVVSEIFETGAVGANLVLATPDGGRLMLPFARQFVEKVEVEAARIDVRIPSGLWEVLEQPVGRKEKRRRKSR